MADNTAGTKFDVRKYTRGRSAYGVAVMVVVVATLALLPLAYARMAAERDTAAVAMQGLAQAIAGQRVQASGTWHSEDGTVVGGWRLLPRIREAGRDAWCATVQWTVDAAPEGTRAWPEYESIVGRLEGGRLVVRREPCPLDPASARDAAQPALADDRRMVEAEAQLHGTLIQGDLTLANGKRGHWHGWWQAWKANVPGVGFTDIEPR